MHLMDEYFSRRKKLHLGLELELQFFFTRQYKASGHPQRIQIEGQADLQPRAGFLLASGSPVPLLNRGLARESSFYMERGPKNI